VDSSLRVADTKQEYRVSISLPAVVLCSLHLSLLRPARCYIYAYRTPSPTAAISRDPITKSHPPGLKYSSIDFFLLHRTSKLAAYPTKQEVPLPARATAFGVSRHIARLQPVSRPMPMGRSRMRAIMPKIAPELCIRVCIYSSFSTLTTCYLRGFSLQQVP
jgi:hypothetical protein